MARWKLVLVILLILALSIPLGYAVQGAVRDCESRGGEWVTYSVKPYYGECKDED